MKGMVFTEFIEFVEDKFGFEISNEIIEESDLKSKGIYTAVGTYDFKEMVSLLVSLSKKTKTPIPVLLEVYGEHLFFRFGDLYPDFLKTSISLFDFISKIDSYIHVEVKKLYPDAELPKIQVVNQDENSIEIVYKSERKLGHFALGLLKSATEYFNEPMEIEMKNLNEEGSEVGFKLMKKDE